MRIVYVLVHEWNSRDIDGNIIRNCATVDKVYTKEEDAKRAVKLEMLDRYIDGQWGYVEAELID